MPLLSDAKKVYAGNSAAKRVYLGTTLAWQDPAEPGPQVVFSAGGVHTTSTTTVITIPAGVAASTTLFFMKNQTGGVTIDDPAVTLITQATSPSTNRFQIYNCDTAGKSFTLTHNAANSTWFVVGMSVPRVGAGALGVAANSTSVITGATLVAAVQKWDRAIGFYACNNAVSAWSTPALETQLFSQVNLGVTSHSVAGLTPALAASGSMILGDADRGSEGTSRMEFSGVALFRPDQGSVA